MKLRLSVSAEDLSGTSLVRKPDPFAVITVLNKEPGSRPTVVGRTETLQNTYSPDWTKLILMDGFELGKSMSVVVTLYDTAKGKNVSMGSSVFEVGKILGSKGNVLAKELKQGGIVVVNVEPFSASPMMKLQLRCLALKNLEGLGIVNKSDPFFELQRLRHSVKGSKLWDTVYRSDFRKNNLNPIWAEIHLDLGVICGNNRQQKMRFVVYDHEGDGKHVCMGKVNASVDDLNNAVAPSALEESNIDESKAFTLMNDGKPSGKLLVAACSIDKLEVPIGIPEIEPDVEIETEFEEDIAVASHDEELVTEASDTAEIPPTFVNYVAGGCQLTVSCAIDCTASNGNPRDPSSLHYFNDDDRNDYEHALHSICGILSPYDSDCVYPLYGFGAKQDGSIQHRFSFGDPASEVDGILELYRKVLRSGLIMSSPRDFSKVILEAGKEANESLKDTQTYSILVIFTNGSPETMEPTKKALEDVQNFPLSIVFVGVGSGDFGKMNSMTGTDNREFVRFVPYRDLKGDPQRLTEAALDNLPSQIESYFHGRAIFPNHPVPPDDIAVLPYVPAEDIEVPMEVDANGEPVVTGEAQTPSEPSKTQEVLGGAFKFGSGIVRKVKNRKMGQFKRRVKNEVNKLSKQTLGMRIV